MSAERIERKPTKTTMPVSSEFSALSRAPLIARPFGQERKRAMWKCEHAIETSASPEAIWALFRDVAGWKRWNAGVEKIEIHGPFAVGTEFAMTPPGQETLATRLVTVRENEIFVDETRVGELVVLVAHRIDRLDAGRTRVTYAMEAAGPGCDEIGPAVSADFPDVLKALVRLAETNREREPK